MQFVKTEDGNFPTALMTVYGKVPGTAVYDATFDKRPHDGAKDVRSRVSALEMARALGTIVKADPGYTILTNLEAPEDPAWSDAPHEPTKDPIIAWCLFEDYVLPVGMAAGLSWNALVQSPGRDLIAEGKVWQGISAYRKGR